MPSFKKHYRLRSRFGGPDRGCRERLEVELEYVGGEKEDKEWMLIEDDKKGESTEGGKPPEVSDEEPRTFMIGGSKAQIMKNQNDG